MPRRSLMAMRHRGPICRRSPSRIGPESSISQRKLNEIVVGTALVSGSFDGEMAAVFQHGAGKISRDVRSHSWSVSRRRRNPSLFGSPLRRTLLSICAAASKSCETSGIRLHLAIWIVLRSEKLSSRKPCTAKHWTTLLSQQNTVAPTHHGSSESIPSQAHCLQLIEARSVLSLQEPLFGRKIGHLRKAKAGGTTCKTRFRPAKRYRGLYGLTSAGPANTKTDPPLARNFWRHPDANAAVRVLEGGV